MYKVDSFVAHQELEEMLNSRPKDGYILLQLIECQPINGVEYVTLIWKKQP